MSKASREMFLGAKVTIKKGTTFYSGTFHNPIDTVGVVDSVTHEPEVGEVGWWRVEWSNGGHNDYREEDLKILGTVTKEEN